VRYEQQILSLNRALESRELHGYFGGCFHIRPGQCLSLLDNGDIIINTANATNFNPGTMVFARVVLSVDGDGQDSLKEEQYSLHAESVEAQLAVA
jgi:hypothetical protein